MTIWNKKKHTEFFSDLEIGEGGGSMRDALLSATGAIEALAPVAEQFFIGIDRDIHKELPGLRSVYANAKAALRYE